jgi:hypothetical protein
MDEKLALYKLKNTTTLSSVFDTSDNQKQNDTRYSLEHAIVYDFEKKETFNMGRFS